MRLAPLFSLIILVLFFSFSSPFFFNTENIMTIALQTSVIGIMAIGVTFVIITAGIDLSLGSVVAFSGVAVGICATLGLPLPICIIAGVLAGDCVGISMDCWSQNDHSTVYRHVGSDDVRQGDQYGDDRRARNLFCRLPDVQNARPVDACLMYFLIPSSTS